MVQTLAVAGLIPEPARVAMARADYQPCPEPDCGNFEHNLRTKDGQCPLGVALEFLGKTDQRGFPLRTPLEDSFLAALSGDWERWTRSRGEPPRDEQDVVYWDKWSMVRAFIRAWDSGQLRAEDLADALGLRGVRR